MIICTQYEIMEWDDRINSDLENDSLIADAAMDRISNAACIIVVELLSHLDELNVHSEEEKFSHRLFRLIVLTLSFSVACAFQSIGLRLVELQNDAISVPGCILSLSGSVYMLWRAYIMGKHQDECKRKRRNQSSGTGE